MFWTNWNEQHPSIMRSTLTGKNAQVVISTDILTPNGLTIDHRAEKLYFSDGSLGKIERCEYDGSQRHVSWEFLDYKSKHLKNICFILAYNMHIKRFQNRLIVWISPLNNIFTEKENWIIFWKLDLQVHLLP